MDQVRLIPAMNPLRAPQPRHSIFPKSFDLTKESGIRDALKYKPKFHPMGSNLAPLAAAHFLSQPSFRNSHNLSL
jgi:hypothetical protein